jgi:formamidase
MIGAAPAFPPRAIAVDLSPLRPQQEASMKTVSIDRSRSLRDEPKTGHNRWHPDIPAIAEVDEGEEVALETRDATDCYLNSKSTEADLAGLVAGAIHPLTGPVLIKGARVGDLLEVEFVDIVPQRWAFTAIMPGLGFLRDVMTTPFIAHWDIADGWATSRQLRGVRIPGASFMGVSGVAPSRAQVDAWARREADLMARGGMVFPPDAAGAVPASGPAATQGLRTLPPRENGGNFDVKQLSKGSKLLLPVAVDGGLFSTGDGHFAQGDGEVCVTAVEMGATCVVRFRVHRGEAERRQIRWPRFQRSDYFIDPRWAVPQRFIATMGMPVDDAGVNQGENLNLACRNALLNMMGLLQERGFSREQAYVICSVAVDLRISNVVDVPNYVVSAFLPEEIFQT